MSETISNIKIDGTTYAINDSSKAGLEEIGELTNVAQNNTELLNSAQTKLDELLLKVKGSGLDTSDATATAANILLGQTAYVNGVKIEGTLDLSQLIPENIVSGIVINGIEGIHVCKTENLPGGRDSYEILVSGVKDCIMMWDAAQRGEIDGVYYEANQPLAESGKQIIWSNGTAYITYSSYDKTWVISEFNTAPTGATPYLYAANSDGFPDETIEFPWNATSWCFSLTGPCGISVTLNN